MSTQGSGGYAAATRRLVCQRLTLQRRQSRGNARSQSSLRDENRRRVADPALKGRATVIPPLRGGGAAARESLSLRATGESETHRTAGGKAARIRSGIYSHLLRDENRWRVADPALKGRAKVIPPLRGGGAAAREFLS